MSEPHKIMHVYYKVNVYGRLERHEISHIDPTFVSADEDSVTIKEHWEDNSGGEHVSDAVYSKSKNVVIKRSIDYAEETIKRWEKNIDALRQQMD